MWIVDCGLLWVVEWIQAIRASPVVVIATHPWGEPPPLPPPSSVPLSLTTPDIVIVCVCSAMLRQARPTCATQ
jgi:hypothetical protein